MKIILKSPYPFLARTKSQEIELDQNDTLLIEQEDYVSIYPLIANQIPFNVDLKSLKENDFYSVFKHSDDVFVLLNLPQRLNVTQKERLNFSGKTCDVFADENKIIFELNDRKVEYLCDHKLKKTRIFKLKDYACVQSSENLYLYNIKKNRLSHFSGEITLNGDILNVTKTLDDSDNCVRTSQYKLNEDIVMQKNEFVRNMRNINIKELAPYKLLESVKAKDFGHALEFLSDKLKESVDREKLSEFFDNFNTFLPLSSTEFITMSLNKKNFITFSFDGDKIEDINIENL